MDAAGKVASAFNGAVLKEPRGFIKIIQWVLSIFAFATTTSVNSPLQFKIACTSNSTQSSQYTGQIYYPFDLESVSWNVIVCDNKTGSQSVSLLQGVVPAAQFYVFVGVIVFLFCLAALVLYIFFDETYRNKDLFRYGYTPMLFKGIKYQYFYVFILSFWHVKLLRYFGYIVPEDFLASVVIVLLWLISSSAWAQGVTDVKFYTDLVESDFFDRVTACKLGNTCTQTTFPNFAGLNVSIIFGFLNMVVWAGNLWFLYKETPWFSNSQSSNQQPPTVSGSTPTTPDQPRL